MGVGEGIGRRTDVDAKPLDVVGAVLDRVDGARDGVFGDAHGIAQAPPDDPAGRVEVEGAAVGGFGQVEGAELGDARGDVGRAPVEVLAAAAREEQHLGLLAREQEGARDVVEAVHVDDEGALVGQGAGDGIVGPAEDFVGRRGVEGFAVGGDFDAVCELGAGVSDGGW